MPIGKANGQHGGDHRRRQLRAAVDHAGQQGRRQRDICVERQVDASGQNDHSLAERHEREAGGLLEDVDHIVDRAEVFADYEADHKQERDDPDFNQHGRRQPPRQRAQQRQRTRRLRFRVVRHTGNANVMIASSVIAGPVSSPVIAPSHMTSVRSHMPTISSSSELIINMANPASANWRMIR